MRDIKDVLGEATYADTSTLRVATNGRRKLLTTEISFLSEHLDAKSQRATVVYIGAAPGIHIHLLSILFPNVVFMLFDPRPFKIQTTHGGSFHTRAKSKRIIEARLIPQEFLANASSVSNYATSHEHRIVLFNHTFTNDHARAYGDCDFVWSDIRTRAYGADGPHDADILYDLSMQHCWVSMMKPHAFMLKFRLPFYRKVDLKSVETMRSRGDVMQALSLSQVHGIDLLTDYVTRKIRYLDGKLLLQPWVGDGSAETRLVSSCMSIKAYDTTAYERTMAYYNKVLRTSIYINSMFDKQEGFDQCNDCSLEASIIRAYDVKYKTSLGVGWLSLCNRYTGSKSLRVNDHGKLYVEKSIMSVEDF